jgi:hypothetical protein
VTVNGEYVFVLYVCVGVVLEEFVVAVSPVPQSMSYLLLVPVGTIVKVTVVPAPPAVVLEVNVTLLTNVFALTLSNISFKSSMASVTEVDEDQPV